MKPAALAFCNLFLLLCLAASSAPAALTEVEVTADRVNLRARPELRAEVVGQVNEGEKLRAVSMGDEWAEVVPPDRIDFWVHRDFVSGGVVVSGPLNVRCGAGINYHTAATLQKGMPVQVRGEFGEWLKIAPPPGAVLYLSRTFVRPVAARAAPPPRPAAPPPPPRTVEVVPPVVRPVPPSSVAPEAPEPYLPTDLRLAASERQGLVVDREGVLRPVAFLLNRPSRYQLATTRGGRPETVCYLRGNDKQLSDFEGRRLRIRGREYWVQGMRYSVVVVDQIAVLP